MLYKVTPLEEDVMRHVKITSTRNEKDFVFLICVDSHTFPFRRVFVFVDNRKINTRERHARTIHQPEVLSLFLSPLFILVALLFAKRHCVGTIGPYLYVLITEV